MDEWGEKGEFGNEFFIKRKAKKERRKEEKKSGGKKWRKKNKTRGKNAYLASLALSLPSSFCNKRAD